MPFYLSPDFGPYSGDRISPDHLEISNPPSPQHAWIDGAWQIKLVPKWQDLENDLTGSPFFAKSYTASKMSLAANTDFTLVMNTITTAQQIAASDTITLTKKLETLEFAIAQLRGSMMAIAEIEDFATEEIAAMNALFEKHQFPITLS